MRLFPAWTEADWRKAAEVAVKGVGLETLVSETLDGLRIQPLYPPLEGRSPLRSDGAWKVIARLDHPDAGEANAQALDDFDGGADGLQVVFRGAIGAYGFGLAKADSATLHAAFQGLRFEFGPRFELDLGPEGPAEALAFAGLVERSGALPPDCDVSFSLDPFAAAARGPFPAAWTAHAKPFVEAALGLMERRFAGPLMVADARSVHAAGGAPGEELAFALAAGVALLRAFEDGGVSLDEARRQIAFRLAADADEFVSLSKFRALRLAWALVEQACALKPEPARVQAESAWRTMTARDPYINVMRGAVAAFAAGLGGADSVSVLPHTLAAGLPDSLARRLARNGQLILLRESNLGFVADPAAGAGAFGALTNALLERGWKRFQEIEAAGGLPSALAAGLVQQAVAASARRLRRRVATLKAPITGVSAHPHLSQAPVELAPGARSPETLLEAAGALAPIRLAEPFERLRARSDAWARVRGGRPMVYIVALGREASHRRRVTNAREWLEVGGFEPVYDGETASPQKAAARLRTSGAPLACLCGDDETYRLQAERFAKAVKAAGVNGLVLAGSPGPMEQALRQSGVDDFITAGGDAVQGLEALYRRIGAKIEEDAR